MVRVWFDGPGYCILAAANVIPLTVATSPEIAISYHHQHQSAQHHQAIELPPLSIRPTSPCIAIDYHHRQHAHHHYALLLTTTTVNTPNTTINHQHAQGSIAHPVLVLADVKLHHASKPARERPCVVCMDVWVYVCCVHGSAVGMGMSAWACCVYWYGCMGAWMLETRCYGNNAWYVQPGSASGWLYGCVKVISVTHTPEDP